MRGGGWGYKTGKYFKICLQECFTQHWKLEKKWKINDSKLCKVTISKDMFNIFTEIDTIFIRDVVVWVQTS